MALYGLPAYIHTPTGRAYLTFSADIHGKWGVGYNLWLEPIVPGEIDPCPAGHYLIVGPVVGDAETPWEAAKQLKEEMDRRKKHGLR